MNTRAEAAKCLNQVIQHGRSLTDVFEQSESCDQTPFIKTLCYGTLRYFYRLNAVADQLLLKPLKPKDQDIFCLLLLGLYQLLYLDTPDYAAVSETVGASQAMKKPWARGLLNKTLRRCLREKDALLHQADTLDASRYNHPTWLINACKKAWPDDWENILEANDKHAPMTLRINPSKTTREAYSKLLEQAGLGAIHSAHAPQAVTLDTPCPVSDLPHFNEGWCAVQDASGQHVGGLLDLQAGQRVLDACAAPGSKTAHILELEPKLARLVAIDKDPSRLKKITENIERLGFAELAHRCLNLHLADATEVQKWWNGNLFDRILVDAPCSATGVIRRHPDIKLLRKPKDISALAEQQFKLLDSLWPLLKPGGLLLYTTCSILPEENERLVSQFIQSEKSVENASIMVKKALKRPVGYQVLPGMENQDGFYYALLRKKES